jgi:sulfatase modifying factor 1
MPRPAPNLLARLGLCGLCVLSACSLITDFSPADRDGASDAADGELRCSDVVSPCPPGMAVVPCGELRMGAPDGGGATDERPQHVVSLSAFCLDRHEVTNVRYAECVRAGVCAPPYSPASATRATYYSDAAYADYPVLHVDWELAAAFCVWTGKRLPTEAEWEKAARGGCDVAPPATCGAEDERTYPWGDEAPTCAVANSAGCGGDTAPVDAHTAGAGPYGLEDLAGNVAEWTADWYDATGYGGCADGCTDPRGPADGTARVVRGGSWNDPAESLRVTHRTAQPPSFAGDALGFRCAASIP